jgi:error-prone DNA polymerase
MFNNYPLGFYSAATLVKDAQRHGLHFRHLDINRSQYDFTVKEADGAFEVQVGLRFVRGLREEIGRKIVEEREQAGSLRSIADLIDRVPEINKREIRALSLAGALNFDNTVHRREALWQSELETQPAGSLFENNEYRIKNIEYKNSSHSIFDIQDSSFLSKMEGLALVDADLRKTGISIGKHPLAFLREELAARGVITAHDARYLVPGQVARLAGAVIVRQRPMTAKNVVFITLEDETGHSNFVVMPDKFEDYRSIINGNDYLIIKGIFEERGMLKAVHFENLANLETTVVSHNFR